MTEDLCLPVKIASVPTVRDPDGLAVSSRNAYLSAAERATALALSRALRAGRGEGQSGPDAVLAAAQHVLDEAAKADPPLLLDYLALVEPDTFSPVKPGFAGDALLLVAARAGTTRLIDNAPLTLGRTAT
jgi:pantoate--beta-alanine ligase